jgi:hypothetical protein
MNKKYISRACALGLFCYLYGENTGVTRAVKLDLIQFTRYCIPLNFSKNLIQQIQEASIPDKFGDFVFFMDDYYTALFQYFIKEQAYFTNMKVEYNLQNKLGGECFIFGKNDDIIVVFRGTEDPLDLLIDLTTVLVPPSFNNEIQTNKALVHAGFYKQLTNYDFHKQIAKILGQMIHGNTRKIQIIGHSLGGALACLFAYYFYKSRQTCPNIDIITIGTPVFGNTPFVNEFNTIFENNIYRVLNENDFIPKLAELFPIIRKIQPLDYRHIGKQTYIVEPNKKIKLVNNDEYKFKKPTSRDIVTLANGHMINYQEYLLT